MSSTRILCSLLFSIFHQDVLLFYTGHYSHIHRQFPSAFSVPICVDVAPDATIAYLALTMMERSLPRDSTLKMEKEFTYLGVLIFVAFIFYSTVPLLYGAWPKKLALYYYIVLLRLYNEKQYAMNGAYTFRHAPFHFSSSSLANFTL